MTYNFQKNHSRTSSAKIKFLLYFSVRYFLLYHNDRHYPSCLLRIRVGVKYSTCTWYLYLSAYLSVLGVLEYLVYENAKVLVLVLDQKVLGTYK